MSRGTQVPAGSCHHFRLRGYHPLWPAVPDCSTSGAICNSTMTGPTTPPNPKKRWFGLFRIRSPLLTESLLFSFPPGTKMVHFPGFASTTYVFSRRYSGFAGVGSPIRRPPDQRLLAAPRGLSQLATSFIAYRRLGIHRVPLVA